MQQLTCLYSLQIALGIIFPTCRLDAIQSPLMLMMVVNNNSTSKWKHLGKKVVEEGRKKGNASDLPVGIPQWKEKRKR